MQGITRLPRTVYLAHTMFQTFIVNGDGSERVWRIVESRLNPDSHALSVLHLCVCVKTA